MSDDSEMMNESNEMADNGDSVADAVAAVALIAIFVFTCVYWVSGQ